MPQTKAEIILDALVFYADPSNYKDQSILGLVTPAPVMTDGGEAARQALEKVRQIKVSSGVIMPKKGKVIV